MIHIRGSDSKASLSTLATKWLFPELSRTKIPGPDRQAVPAVPGCALPAGRRLWLVSRTPAISGQLCAAWVPAGPQRFACHGLSPPRSSGKIKSYGQQLRISAPVIGRSSQSIRPSQYPRYFQLCISCNMPQCCALQCLGVFASDVGCDNSLDIQPTCLSLSTFYHVWAHLARVSTPFPIS